jgi:hypothetical protein
MFSKDFDNQNHAVKTILCYGNSGVYFFQIICRQGRSSKIPYLNHLSAEFSLVSSKSTKSLLQSQAIKRNNKMDRKYASLPHYRRHFLCWMPFMIICILHCFPGAA